MADPDPVLSDTPPDATSANGVRVLVAKTSLDGHWRGVTVVGRALRDAGFEVVLLGMVTAAEITRAAIDEDVDLVGLNIGGRVQVAERIIESLRSGGYEGPVIAGGTIPPYAVRRLNAVGVECFPPGSPLADIVAASRRLVGLE